MNWKVLGLLAMGLVGEPIIGNAQTVVTIDPNNYAAGTDISTATPGVTLDYIQVAGDLGWWSALSSGGSRANLLHILPKRCCRLLHVCKSFRK